MDESLNPHPGRMVPMAVGLNADYYRLAAETGVLHVQRCEGCATHRHPPRLSCAICGSDAWIWVPTGMRGEIWSWTVTHRVTDPAFLDEGSFAIVVVELDEGVRVVGNTIGIAHEELRIGLPVRIVLDRRSDAVALIDVVPD
jgi:uncharacterized OB-fold protein